MVGVVDVPDERLDRLTELYEPAKTTHATIEFVDIAVWSRQRPKQRVSIILSHQSAK